MQMPQNNEMQLSHDISMQDEMECIQQLSQLSMQDSLQNNCQPIDYNHSESDEGDDEMELDDSYDELFDFDFYDLPTEKRSDKSTSQYDIVDEMEAAKENLKPVLMTSSRTDSYEEFEGLKPKSKLEHMTDSEKDRHIEDNALVDISNRWIPSSNSSQFNSKCNSLAYAKR